MTRLSVAVAVLAFLAAPLRAQKVGEFVKPVDGYKGEDVYHDSARLPAEQATAAYNVITEHGYIEKRPGSVVVSTAIASVENMTQFVRNGGNSRVIVLHSSSSIYYTDFSSSPVALATVAYASNVSFVTAYNKLIAVDGNNEVEWDGTSTGTTVGFPTCKFVEQALDRIWCGSVTSESTSRVRISSVGGTGYWTVPVNPNAVPNGPFYFDINRDDGQPITCLKNTPWGVVVGKARSMWVIKGLDNTNWYVKNLDPAVGCADNRTMQVVDGRLEWLGPDGVYSWNGGYAWSGTSVAQGTFQLESLPIDPVIKTTRQSSSQSNSIALFQTADWSPGVFVSSGAGPTEIAPPASVIGTSATFVDGSTTSLAAGTSLGNTTFTVSGLQLSSVTAYDDWTDGDYTNGPTTWTVLAGPWAVSTDGKHRLYSQAVNSSAGATARTIYTAQPQASTGTWWFTHVGIQNISDALACTNVAGLVCWLARPVVAANGDYYEVRLVTDGANNDLHYLQIRKSINSVVTTLSSTSFGFAAGESHWTRWRISRSTAGVLAVFYTQQGNPDVFISSTSDLAISTYGVTQGFVLGGAAFQTNAVSSVFNYFSTYTFVNVSTAGSFLSQSFDTVLSTPVWGNFNVQLSSDGASTYATFRTQTSADNSSWDALVSASAAAGVASARKRYIRYQVDMISDTGNPINLSTATPVLTQVKITGATTGYYNTPVEFVGSDIATWGSLDINQTLPSTATISFFVRQATYSFAADSSGIAWTAQVPNQTINLAISTPTYVQAAAFFNFLNADNAPALNLLRFNWKNGSPTGLAASGFLNHRYYLCVAINSAANDTCLIQQRTRDWVFHTGLNVGALTLYSNNTIYGGSSGNDGSIWKLMADGVYNDAGVAIDSYWVSPDYMFADVAPDALLSPKSITEMWVDAMPSTGTTLSVGYAVDRSTSYVTKNLSLTSAKAMVNQRVPLDAGFALGKYFRVKFENSDLNKYFRINGHTIIGAVQPRRDN